jgi:outer membrane protein OmpA-like peptidoglycan-associated protein
MRKIFFGYTILMVCLLSASALLFAQDFKLEATLAGNKGEVQNVRFSPDGKLLAGGDEFGNVLIWNVKSKALERTLNVNIHKRRVLEVTFNKSGSMLASTCEDGTVIVWDTKTWKTLSFFKNKPFLNFDGSQLISSSFVVFSPNNRYVYFGGDNGYIMKGLIAPNAVADSVFSTNESDGRWYSTITGGCISQDERHLIITVKHLVLFLDLKTDMLAKYFRYDEGGLNDVVNGPLPNTIATWSDDGKVNIWNSSKSEGVINASFQVTTPGNYSGASFSKDGRYLVSSASGIVAKIWDMTNGRQIATLDGHTRIVRISRFSPTENMVATASYDGSVKLWKDKKEDTPPAVVVETPTKDTIVTKPVLEEPPAVIADTPKKDVLKDIKIEEIKEGDVIQLENILFRQSRPELLVRSNDEVEKLIGFMKKYPTVEIELSGHTDNVGDASKNQKLSEQRVIVVRNILIRNGVKDSRIQTIAYGGSKPIADNRSEAGRQKNRRVEMKILKK